MSSQNTTFEPSLFGQIVTTGWIGEAPMGGDFAFLAAYSPGDGELGPKATRLALRGLVEAWGMREGGMVESPQIGDVPVTAVLDGTTVTVTGFPGLDMTRPVSAEWAALAKQHGQIFFTLTTRPWPDGPTASEAAAFRFFEADATINTGVHMLLPVTAKTA
jgi:hypothetical protein